jgi:CMP-N-acetylneuraminic acid synthetase
MKYYAFIFARKGSQRLRNKNLKKINGLSLVEHSINIAKKIKVIKKIFVSSDDPKILKIAKKKNCLVIKRPKTLAKNTSPEWLSWRHALNEYDLQKEYDKFNFISLPVTSPMRSVNDIKKCIKIFDKGKYDSLFTISKTTHNSFYNVIYKKNNKLIYNKALKNSFNSRQKFPEAFFISTLAFILKPKFIIKKKSLFDGKFKTVEFNSVKSIDIDNKIDFMIAKDIYEKNY